MKRTYKDYSEHINKQFGELTILEISDPIKENNSQRICKCKCSCGKTMTATLMNILNKQTRSCGHLRQMRMQEMFEVNRKRRNERREANDSNESTQIKNISFSHKKGEYRVDIMRNGERYYDYTNSLEEAIKIKERILRKLGEM